MQVFEPIRTCYFNSLYKHYKNVCDYNITLKRIDGIIKGGQSVILLNKIVKISIYQYSNI